MIIPFVGGAEETRSPDVNNQRTINWFVEVSVSKDGAKVPIALYPTPGSIIYYDFDAA